MAFTPIGQTGHIGLNVTDLARSKQFYQRLFGFRLVHESLAPGRRFAFLSDGERLSLTLWEQAQGNFVANQPGLHHLSFQLPSLEAVKAAEKELKALGTRFHYDGIVAHREGEDSGGIYFEDPDGIRLEIYAPSGVKGQPAPAGGAPACGFF